MYRITPDGKATIIFEPKELQVQALRIGPGGAIYAATAPDGKVYKLEHKPGATVRAAKADPDSASDKYKDKDATKPAADPSWSSSVYFEPGTKYIWDLALDKSGNLYVAPVTTGKFIALRRRASIPSSSRAMKLTFAFWPSMHTKI